MKKIIVVTFLIFFSATTSAGIIDDIWESLKQMLGMNITKTVNNQITPANSDCQPNIDSSEIDLSNANLANEEIVEEGEEAEVGFSAKTDSDADYLRDILKNNFKKLGGDPVALEQALCFYDKNRSINFNAAGDPSRSKGIKIQNQRYITINDLNKSSLKARMYVLDLETGQVKSYFSGHGIGGKNGVAESSMDNVVTSNKESSYATPRGFFITGSRVNGSSDPQQRWTFSMKLHGLQKEVNDKAYSRAVVMHAFPGMDPTSLSSDEEKPNVDYRPMSYAMSWGCTMIAPPVANEIINTIKAPNNNSGGSLYYNYSDVEKSRGESYCGDEKLMTK